MIDMEPRRGRPSDPPDVTDLRLELIARGQETRTYFIRAEDGFRRIVRLIEADMPVEAHKLASAGVVAMSRARAAWPEDVA